MPCITNNTAKRTVLLISILLIFVQTSVTAVETLDGDRAVLFILGPDRAGYLKIIDVPFLEQHFDEVAIIETDKPNWISKIGNYNNYNEVFLFFALHGKLRLVDGESYIHLKGDVNNNTRDFKKWLNDKSIPFPDMVKTEKFFNTVKAQLKNAGHLTHFLEICDLKLKNAAEIPVGTLNRPFSDTMMVPDGIVNQNDTVITQLVTTDQSIIEYFQEAIKNQGKYLVRTNDLERILTGPQNKSVAIKGSKYSREFINPRILKIIRNTGGKPEVLKIINLTEQFKNVFVMNFTVNGTRLKLEKDGGKEIYTLRTSDGNSREFDLTHITVTTVDIRLLTMCRLTIQGPSADSTHPKPGSHPFKCGRRIEVEAFGNSNYTFDYWEGVPENEKKKNPVFITVNGDNTIRAVFIKKMIIPPAQRYKKYSLKIQTEGEGRILNHHQQTLDTPITLSIFSQKMITLQAQPAEGWYFQEWRGDITGKNPKISVTSIRNISITAIFLKSDSDIPTKPAAPQIKNQVKQKIPKTSQEYLLTNYLYYSTQNSLARIDISKQGSHPEYIENPAVRPNFTTSVYPDEDETGNRFIALYGNTIKNNPSFSVYDKLLVENAFQQYPFDLSPKQYHTIEIIYPVDYPAGGNYIYSVFLAVVCRAKNDKAYREFDIFQYGKSENGDIIKKLIASGVLSHYYNPYQKKLAILKQISSSQLGIKVYAVRDQEITDTCKFDGTPGEIQIRFYAFNYLALERFGRQSNTLRIYRLAGDTISPVEKYSNPPFFSGSLRHDSMEFHLLIAQHRQNNKGLLLEHKEFNLEVGETLINRAIPQQITGDAGNREEVIELKSMVNVNTYYFCLVYRTENGYGMTFYRLSDSFRNVIGAPVTPDIPTWLANCDEDLLFKVEENTMLIQSIASGSIIGAAYINENGEIKFSPQ